MSMSNLIQINIHFMDMKRHMLVYFFTSMLVDREKSEVFINWEVVIKKGEK
jgi:hypothetical protein